MPPSHLKKQPDEVDLVVLRKQKPKKKKVDYHTFAHSMNMW